MLWGQRRNPLRFLVFSPNPWRHMPCADPENLVPGFLIQERELLRQFHLDCLRACSLLVDAPKEGVMALDCRQSLYQNTLHNFPTGLQQADATVSASAFRQEDHHGPSHLLRDASMLPNGLC
jgi:hypothetical protein